MSKSTRTAPMLRALTLVTDVGTRFTRAVTLYSSHGKSLKHVTAFLISLHTLESLLPVCVFDPNLGSGSRFPIRTFDVALNNTRLNGSAGYECDNCKKHNPDPR